MKAQCFILLWITIEALNYKTSFKIYNKEFTLIMRSTELIHRYTFYGGIWETIGKYLGIPIVPGFQLNSKTNISHS